jgi:hypothetical protein
MVRFFRRVDCRAGIRTRCATGKMRQMSNSQAQAKGLGTVTQDGAA